VVDAGVLLRSVCTRLGQVCALSHAAQYPRRPIGGVESPHPVARLAIGLALETYSEDRPRKLAVVAMCATPDQIPRPDGLTVQLPQDQPIEELRASGAALAESTMAIREAALRTQVRLRLPDRVPDGGGR